MGYRREKYEAERDRQIIAELYLKGFSSRAIAQRVSDEVGEGYTVSHTTVASDIRYLLKVWEKDRINDINKQKIIELEKIDKLEQTYWDAWEKSITDSQKKATKLKGKVSKEASSPEYQEKTTTDVINYGNPAFLQGVERCIERRCKILGIDAPTKLDHTSMGMQITAIKVVHVSKDEFKSEANGDGSNPSVQQDEGSIQRQPI